MKIANCKLQIGWRVRGVLAAAWLLMDCNAAPFFFGQQGVSSATYLTFANSEIFAPHLDGSPKTFSTAEGSALDSQLLNGSRYAVYGPSNATKTIDVTFKLTAGYAGGSFGEWPNDGHIHGGHGLRIGASSADFGGLVMLSAEADELQVVDRVAGAETIVAQRAVTGGVAYDQVFRLLIENTTGDDCRVRLYSEGGTELDDYTWTMTSGVPATGRAFTHTYACVFVTTSVKLLDGAGATIIDNGAQVYADIYPGTTRSRSLVASGALDLFCNGANLSDNSWGAIVSKVSLADFTMTGTYKRVSATRIGGIVFRQQSSATPVFYCVYHDTSNGLRLGRFSGSTLTVISTQAKTLTTGTAYNFTLTVTGSNIDFTIDGTTVNWSDATITGAGFVGFMGFQSNVQFSNIVIQ